MKHVTKVGRWQFEVKEVKAIKVENYGDPYTAIGTIRITNGEANVEGLLSQESLEPTDRKDLEKALKEMGFTKYNYENYIDGKRTVVTRKIA